MDPKRRSKLARRIEERILAFDTALATGDTPVVSKIPALNDEQLERLSGTHDLLARLDSMRRRRMTDRPSPATGWSNNAPRQLGRFEIVRELGRGGHGVVFLARDAELQRDLALKVPRPELVFDDDLRQRFRQEAKAAASLDHPNIVAIHEIGEVDSVCFIAAAYVAGPTLGQWMREYRATASDRQIARLIECLAHAVEHAHRRGVLHRDLKPANVLLEPCSSTNAAEVHRSLDEYVPKLADFGLARMESQAGHTRTGTLVGTPAYMAPEQANGRVREIGPATDVYALGAILYELLTGRPPYVGENDADTLRLLTSDVDVLPLSRYRAGLPEDLEAICLKCLEQSASDRYQSAAEFAADLRRFLLGQPTLARPLGPWGRTWKWGRRRPAVAALFALGISAGLTILGVSLWYNATLTAALSDLQRSEAARRESLYAADIQLAARAVDEGNPTQARRLLDQCVPGLNDAEDVRGFEWFYLDQLVSAGAQELDQSSLAYVVKYSPDGRWIAGGRKDGFLSVWDAATNKLQSSWETGHGEINGLSISRDGNLIATGGDDGAIRVWDRKTKSLKSEILGAHPNQCWNVIFTAADKRLISCGNEVFVRIWDVQTKRCVLELDTHSRFVHAIALSPDERLLAVACDDGRASVWDVLRGKQLHNLRVSDDRVNGVAFNKSGTILGTASADGRVTHWSLPSERKIWASDAHADGVQALAVGAGHVTVSGDRSGNIRVWREQAPRERVLADAWRSSKQAFREVDLRAGDRFGASLASDGDLLAVGAPDALVREHQNNGRVNLFRQNKGDWQFLTCLEPRELKTDQRFGTTVAVSGSYVAVGSSPNEGQPAKVGLFAPTEEDSDQWQQVALLTAEGLDDNSASRFGRTLAWKDQTLLVSDCLAQREQGSIYIYDTSQLASLEKSPPFVLTAPEPHTGERFGSTFAWDGELLVVGADTTNAANTKQSRGVYLFRQGEDSQWKLSGIIAPDDCQARDQFGAAVAVENDTVLVAAPHQPQTEGRVGAVYAFRESSPGTWKRVAKLVTPYRWKRQGFGDALAIRQGTIAVGAVTRGDSALTGSLHILQPSTPEAIDWEESSAITFSRRDGEFGRTALLHGSSLLSSAPREPGAPHAGVVFSHSIDASPQTSKSAVIEQSNSGWSAHAEAVWSVDVSNDQAKLVSAGNDGAIRQWSLNRDANPRTFQPSEGLAGVFDFLNESSVIFGPGGYDLPKSVYLTIWGLELRGAAPCFTWPGLMDGALAMAPDRQSFAAASARVQWCSARDGKILKEWPQDGNWFALAFAPDGRELAAAEHRDDFVSWLDLDTCAERLRTPLPDPRDLVFLDAERLAVASQNTVTILARSNGAVLQQWLGHQAGVRVLARSPDGLQLASAGEDRVVRIWDATNGQQQYVLSGHREPVRSLAFSVDGRTLASGSDDGTVRLWHTKTGQPLIVHDCREAVRYVRFSPSGDRLAAFTKLCHLILFHTNPGPTD